MYLHASFCLLYNDIYLSEVLCYPDILNHYLDKFSEGAFLIPHLASMENGIISNDTFDHSSRTFAMVKPDAIHRLGEIVDVIQSRDFEISQMKMVQLLRHQAAAFYREHEGRPFFE